MAILHVKTPNGTTKTVDLETMNITSSLQQNGWCKLPNGLIIQWGRLTNQSSPSQWIRISLVINMPNFYFCFANAETVYCSANCGGYDDPTFFAFCLRKLPDDPSLTNVGLHWSAIGW